MESIINNSHWLFFTSAAILVALEIIILKRLKRNHYPVYTELGSPNVYLNLSLKKTQALTQFIIKQKYKSLNDIKLNIYSKLFMFNLLIALIFLAIFAILKEQ